MRRGIRRRADPRQTGPERGADLPCRNHLGDFNLRCPVTEILESFGFAAQYTCSGSPVGLNHERRVQFHPQRLAVANANKGVTIRVVPAAGMGPWIGNFATISDAYPLTGVFATPSPVHMCVIAQGAGYVVPVCDPQNYRSVPSIPILGVTRVPERPYLLLWGFQDLIALGAEGLVWQIDHLGIDGFNVTSVQPHVIRGTTFAPSSGPDPYIPEREVEFAVDPLTGAVTGGWGGHTVDARPRPWDQIHE